MILPVLDWQLRQRMAPARVCATRAFHGLRDWTVVCGNGKVMNFGMAMLGDQVRDDVEIDDPPVAFRNRRNPFSERNYASAVRFARWVNRPPSRFERVVSWCRGKWHIVAAYIYRRMEVWHG